MHLQEYINVLINTQLRNTNFNSPALTRTLRSMNVPLQVTNCWILSWVPENASVVPTVLDPPKFRKLENFKEYGKKL